MLPRALGAGETARGPLISADARQPFPECRRVGWHFRSGLVGLLGLRARRTSLTKYVHATQRFSSRPSPSSLAAHGIAIGVDHFRGPGSTPRDALACSNRASCPSLAR